jgi:AmmeMemoRadiSam system protein B
MASSHTSTIRPAAVAGSFYPHDPRALRAQVGSLLADVDPAHCGERARAPKMLIAPHAGYQYSGGVAAQAYALLAPHRDRIRRVVLIGPAHRVAFRGIAVPSVDAFWSPLGAVPLDFTAIAQLKALPQVVVDDAPHAWEHALEVHLPFLQSMLAEFAIVPLIAGNVSSRDVAQVLEALWGGQETLIVISSDLSHYHEHALASRIDASTVQSVLRLEVGIDHDQACGATAIDAAVLCARRHGLSPRLLDLRNSGDTAGPRDRVVGYCAIAFDEPEGDDDKPQ